MEDPADSKTDKNDDKKKESEKKEKQKKAKRKASSSDSTGTDDADGSVAKRDRSKAYRFRVMIRDGQVPAATLQGWQQLSNRTDKKHFINTALQRRRRGSLGLVLNGASSVSGSSSCGARVTSGKTDKSLPRLLFQKKLNLSDSNLEGAIMDDVVDVFEDERGKAYLSYRQIKKERKEFNEDAFRHSTDKQALTPQQAAKLSKATGRTLPAHAEG